MEPEISTEALPDRRAVYYARRILVQSALLGVLADALLRNPPWGIGLAIWIAAVGTTAVALNWQRGERLTREQTMWFWLSIACAALFAWRDAEMLLLASFGAMLFAMAMSSMSLAGAHPGSVFAARVRDTPWVVLRVIGNAAAGVARLVFKDAALDHLLRSSASSRRGASAIRAALITLPVVLVFWALLTSADPLFASIFALPDVDFGTVVSHVVVAGIFAWITAGWMRGALAPATDRRRPPDGMPFSVGAMDLTALLGALNVLFALFVAVQLGWMFRPEAVLQQTIGLTVAEYARRGFFELVAVTVLVVPITLGTRAAAGEDEAALRRHTRLSLPLLALLGMIMVSAMLRMSLYVQHFGLTTDRLYASAFMLWLAVVFVAMTLTVLRGWGRPFAAAAVLSGYGMLFALAFASPDEIVARVNLSRTGSTRPIDYRYMSRLGADAAPQVAAKLSSEAPSGETCTTADAIRSRWSGEYRPWPQWSVARSRARKAVQAHLTPATVRRLCSASARPRLTSDQGRP